MKQFLKIFTLFILLGLSIHAQAQEYKYGYVNSQEIISLLPEATAANTALEKYQDKLSADFEKKVTNWQSDVEAFQLKVGKGEMPPAQQQELGAGLQKRQEALAKEEKGLSQKLNEKRNELLEPILVKVDNAIKEIGKDGKYTMIFDSGGMNVMLYLDEALDLTPKVKAKLGLK
jgi:outer membrane protein